MADHIDLDEVDPTSSDLGVDELRTNKRLLGFLYTISGTTASGQTLTVADLGRLVVDIYDDQRINVPTGFFHSWSRIHRGTIDGPTGNAATAERLSLFVPMFVPGAGPNTIPILEKEAVEADFQHDQSTLGTRFTGTPTANARAVYVDRIGSNYIPEYKKSTLQFTSATDLDESFTQGNIPGIYIREAEGNTNSDIIDRIDVTVDNQTVTRQVSDEEIDDLSTILAQTESPVEPWKFQDTTDGPVSQGGYQNNEVIVDVTTNNSGNVEIVRSRRVELEQVANLS